ncbi:SRPBCC family protein [Nocardioides nanhaiensis]|uniref:SRPBCC family protein n=1 Tax=Nocardioides nanhaiensis TaxID=1476871 RepID=A0ABP8VSA7_9ACTN
MSDLRATGSIEVDAPASTIFDILADPRQHSVIDGSGTVRDSVSGPERLSLGAKFGMDMKMGAPYKIGNTVVEFEPDRLIAWRHKGLHRWRYELEPVAGNPGRTRVTETWDASYYPTLLALGLKAAGFPARNQAGIDATLPKLKAEAERRA